MTSSALGRQVRWVSRVASISLLLLGSLALAQEKAKGKGKGQAAAKAEPAKEGPARGSLNSGDDSALLQDPEEPKPRFAPSEADKEKAEQERAEREEQQRAKAASKPTRGVDLDVVAGFGSAPIVAPNGPDAADGYTGKATAFSFIIGGHYDVSESIRAMIRLPWSTASVEQTDKSKLSTSALGSPELLVRFGLGAPGPTRMYTRFGLALPLAQGEADPTNIEDTPGQKQRVVQHLASAARGWHDPELFMLTRLPVSGAFGLQHAGKGFAAGAEAKLVFAPALGGTINVPTDPDGRGKFTLSSLAIVGVLGGGGSVEVIEHGSLGLDSWIVYDAVKPVELQGSQVSPSPFVWVIEPRAAYQIGPVLLGTGPVLPLAGQLAGKNSNTGIWGWRLRAEVLL